MVDPLAGGFLYINLESSVENWNQRLLELFPDFESATSSGSLFSILPSKLLCYICLADGASVLLREKFQRFQFAHLDNKKSAAKSLETSELTGTKTRIMSFDLVIIPALWSTEMYVS